MVKKSGGFAQWVTAQHIFDWIDYGEKFDHLAKNLFDLDSLNFSVYSKLQVTMGIKRIQIATSVGFHRKEEME